MSEKKNFITTSDEATAEELKKAGFRLLTKDGNRYTFLNDGSIHFSNIKEKKVAYTNMLPM